MLVDKIEGEIFIPQLFQLYFKDFGGHNKILDLII